MTGIGREIMWGVPAWAPAAMYGAFAVVLLVAGHAFARRVSAWRRGRPEREDRFDRLPARFLSLLKVGLLQTKVAERIPSGLFHIGIFAGFLVLTIATALVAIQYDLGIEILDGTFYLGFKIFADAFGLLLLLGCAGALFTRAFLPPPGYLRGAGEIAPVALLFFVGLTGFAVETLRLAATRPSAGWASFASDAAVPALSGLSFGTLLSAHEAAWWIHLALAFLFLASVPYSKMLHLATGPASIFLRSSRPKGALQDVPDIEETDRPGVLAVADFSWKQLLSADACTRCGRCQDECPASAAEMPLSPRDVVLRTAASAPACEGNRFAFEVLTPGAIWSCTTCRACVQACPVSIEHVDMVVDVRRGFVSEGKIPDSARVALRKMGDTGNPWGMPQGARLDWAEGLALPLASDGKPFEYLYWVGCAAAYDPRARKVARAVATLLLRAGIDFAVLGPEETCCGESARRLGEEGLFRLGTVEAVKEAFARYGVRKLVTGCPHCDNTFRNEYPSLGVSVEAVHHSVFLAGLVERGLLRPLHPFPSRVAFHDSCYLGRYNDRFVEPRSILSSIPGVRLEEAAFRKERSFCCGAGGGAMWLELPGKRINHLRFDQLRGTGATEIASACPYCLSMFDDAIKHRGEVDIVRAKDVAEYLEESTRGGTGEGTAGTHQPSVL